MASLINQYLGHTEDTAITIIPRIYLAYPSIYRTSIFTLNIVLEYLILLVMYITYWLGSQQYGVIVYNSTYLIVQLILAKQSTLDAIEVYKGVGKQGSTVNQQGREYIDWIEVDRQGWGGLLGEKIRKKGRYLYAKDLIDKDK